MLTLLPEAVVLLRTPVNQHESCAQLCPEGRHRRQERLVERCDVFRGRSPDIKLSPVNFVPVFKFAKRSVIIFVIFYWVHYTSFVSSVCIISIIFGLFTWGSDFFKEVRPTVEGGALWCLRPPPESPVPHKVFVLVKAFGSCSLFAVLFISVGPSLGFYPLIYKSILKYICQRLSRNPDMFCYILLSTVMECNKDSAHGLRGCSIQNRSWCLFNEQCVYVPPYKNVTSPKDTRKK